MARRRLLSAFLGAVFLGLVVLASPSASARAETVVSLTFDDGAASQLFARDQLLAHRMRGTFYIISGAVGSNSYYMTWDDIAGLAATGNEIGGHTLNHKVLTTLKPPEARAEVCDDREQLIDHGYDPVSFAYPTGANNTPVQHIVRDCGYASARRVGGLTHSGCGTCEDAESIPPGNAYALRSNAADDGPMSLAELQQYVVQGEAAGDGWVPLTFHDICSPCTPTSVAESISPSDFAAFLDWLKAREAGGTVVKSVRAVMGFPEPPLPSEEEEEEPKPVVAFAPPRDTATAFTSLKARSRQDVDKLYVSAAMGEPGTLSAYGTVTLGKRYRLKKVRVTTVPGRLTKLRLALTKKGLRAVKRALRRHARVRAVVTIVATDSAGNVQRATRTITLRP